VVVPETPLTDGPTPTIKVT